MNDLKRDVCEGEASATHFSGIHASLKLDPEILNDRIQTSLNMDPELNILNNGSWTP